MNINDSKYELEDILGKLTRIETRMMRGFEFMGVNVKATPGWFVLKSDENIIELNSDHYTLHAIIEELNRLNVNTNGQYRVIFQNKTLCYI